MNILLFYHSLIIILFFDNIKCVAVCTFFDNFNHIIKTVNPKRKHFFHYIPLIIIIFLKLN
jgi:hypothetical protein